MCDEKRVQEALLTARLLLSKAIPLFVATGLSLNLGNAQTEQQRSPLEAYNGPVGVIEAFRVARIVALPDRHQDRRSSQFRIDLVTQPRFAATVNDIVVEWGNRLYQTTLDRYIAGDDVAEADLQKIWRNTVVLTGMWDSPLYREFLSSVRNTNKELPRSRRLRVLAGDPPIDWTKVETKEQWAQFARQRDESVVSVLENEVLAKHRTALVIMGSGHLLRGLVKDGPGVVDRFENAHTGERILVIGVSPGINRQLRLYPGNSFFFTKKTWLEEMSSARGMLIYDAVLTLPDGERVRPMSSVYDDPEYFHELDRRWRLALGKPFDPSMLP